MSIYTHRCETCGHRGYEHSGDDMKRGQPLQRLTPLHSSSSLRGSGLSPVSAKRRRQNATYSTLRREFLAEHPRCEFPLGCPERATEVQHRRGRRGARLLDVAWWASSCHDHNAWAEDHTGEALACGWLVRIESVA